MGMYAGDLRIAFENQAGVSLGFGPNVYTDRFLVNTPSELKQVLGKTRNSYNQPIWALSQLQPATAQFSLLGNNKDAFRVQFLAALGVLTQTSGTQTPAAQVLRAGLALKVPHRDISAVTITSDPVGTTYVLDTDYVVTNARLGLIEVIAGSDLADDIAAADPDDGLPVLVGYAFGAITGGSRLLAGGNPAIYGKLLFDGVELASRKDVDIEVPRILLRPGGDVDLLSSDPISVQVDGQVIQVPGETAPFYVNYPQG